MANNNYCSRASDPMANDIDEALLTMSSMLKTGGSACGQSNQQQQLGNSVVYGNSLRHPPTCTTDCCYCLLSVPAPLPSPSPRPSHHRGRSSSSTSSFSSSSSSSSSSSMWINSVSGSSCSNHTLMMAAAAGFLSPCPLLPLCCSSAENSEIVSAEEEAVNSSFEGSIDCSNNTTCNNDDQYSGGHYWIQSTSSSSSSSSSSGHPTRILLNNNVDHESIVVDHSIIPPAVCICAENEKQHPTTSARSGNDDLQCSSHSNNYNAVMSSRNRKAKTIARSTGTTHAHVDDYGRPPAAAAWGSNCKAAEGGGQFYNRCDHESSILLRNPHEQQTQLEEEMAAADSSFSKDNNSSSSGSSRITSSCSCSCRACCMNSNAFEPDSVAAAMNSNGRHTNYDYDYTNDEFREAAAELASSRNGSIWGSPKAHRLGAAGEHDQVQQQRQGDHRSPTIAATAISATPSHHRTRSVRSRSRAATEVPIMASFSTTPDIINTVVSAAAACRVDDGRSTRTRHCCAASAAVDCVGGGDQAYHNFRSAGMMRGVNYCGHSMAMEADSRSAAAVQSSPAAATFFKPPHHMNNNMVAMLGCRCGGGQLLQPKSRLITRRLLQQPHHARNESDSFLHLQEKMNHRRGAESWATPMNYKQQQQSSSGGVEVPSSSSSRSVASNYGHGAAAGYKLNCAGHTDLEMERIDQCSSNSFSDRAFFRSAGGNIGHPFNCSSSRERYYHMNSSSSNYYYKYPPFPGRGAPPYVLCQGCHSPLHVVLDPSSPLHAVPAAAPLQQKLRCNVCTKTSRFRFHPPPHHHHHRYLHVPTSSSSSSSSSIRRSNTFKDVVSDESSASSRSLPSLHPIVSAADDASSAAPSTKMNLSGSSPSVANLDVDAAASAKSHFQHETISMGRFRWNPLRRENSASNISRDVIHHLAAGNEEYSAGTRRHCTSLDDARFEDMSDGDLQLEKKKKNIHNSGLSVDAFSSFSPFASLSYEDDEPSHADRFDDPTTTISDLQGVVSDRTKCCSIYNNIIFGTGSDREMQNSSDDSRRSTVKDAATMMASAATADGHPARESSRCNCDCNYMCMPSGNEEDGTGNYAVRNKYNSCSTPVAQQYFLFQDSSQSHVDDDHRFHQEEPVEHGFIFDDSIGADSDVYMYTSSSAGLLQWKQQQQQKLCSPGPGSALQEHLAYISTQESRSTHDDQSEPNVGIHDWKASNYVSDSDDPAAADADHEPAAAGTLTLARFVGGEDQEMDSRRNSKGSSRSRRSRFGIGGGFLRKSFKELGRRSFKSMAIAMNLKEEEEEEEEHRPGDVVVVNGQIIPETILHMVEGEAGPVHPGYYWYDYHAGFWGVAGGPCLGIIPPFIEEFKFPLTRDCAGGDTGILVNGRELHKKDLSVLMRRGFPDTPDMSYAMDISGHVVDTTSGKLVRDLGKLAPSMERRGRGYGMFHPNL